MPQKFLAIQYSLVFLAIAEYSGKSRSIACVLVAMRHFIAAFVTPGICRAVS